MVVVPMKRPDVADLNSYYLDIEKFIEHYLGAFGSGCIHFKSKDSQGAVYFDAGEIIGGIFTHKRKQVHGEKSVDTIVQAATKLNFSVDVFLIDPSEIFLWASMADAQLIYKDLSAEFTDFDALIRKMKSEKLTGFVTLEIENSEKGGILFLNNGTVMGGSFSETDGEGLGLEDLEKRFKQTAKQLGGVFHVGRISPHTEKREEETDLTEDLPKDAVPDVLPLLEELLIVVERVITNQKKIKIGFKTLLKKTCVQLADKYTFLDPFAAEFTYANRKISFTGSADNKDLVKGVVEAIKGLSSEGDIHSQLSTVLNKWGLKHKRTLADIGVTINHETL